MVVKQERTGQIKWLKELRETEWHPYIKDLLRQNISKERLRSYLTFYLEMYKLLDGDLEMFCRLAKANFEVKHPNLYLVFKRRSCDNPNCGTCQATHRWHYPYPRVITKGKKIKEGAKSENIPVKRPNFIRFLVEECGFMESQAHAMLDLIDLRHLWLRKYYYEVEGLKNLGLV